MYLKDYLENFKDKKIKLFVDMDGVIADFVVGDAGHYDIKRPLFDSIKKLEEISKMPNVELFIFSATRMNSGINEKNYWLDKYAPFFKRENRIILSREANSFIESSKLKEDYLKKYEKDDSIIILIDDDPKNLFAVKNTSPDVILLKDTALVD